MAEREYYCVDCGRIHVASLWYVRQVNEVGRPLMKDRLPVRRGSQPPRAGAASTVDASRILHRDRHALVHHARSLPTGERV